MLDKLKILVPLDISDIQGAANEDNIDSHYKYVFEEALSLAKSLNFDQPRDDCPQLQTQAG